MGKHTEAKEKTNKKQEKGKQKKRKIGRRIFVLILIILAVLGGMFAKKVYDLDGNWLAALMGHNRKTLENLDKVQILVLGESTGMSDTIIVCNYDPKTQQASLLSIPRDTFVGESQSRADAYDKINSLYSSGKTPEKTLAAINKLTGLNIEKYMIIDTKALKELVNIIGGVNFDVPINMKYDDYSQDLHVNLKAGQQKLNGDQAEQVVRFRHNNNGSTYSYDYGIEDYGRMKTQRNLITAVAKQTIKFKNITEINKIVDVMEKYVKTNFNIKEFKDYIPYAIEINPDNIKSQQLPGSSKMINGISFFLADKDETTGIVNELFNSTNTTVTENQ